MQIFAVDNFMGSLGVFTTKSKPPEGSYIIEHGKTKKHNEHFYIDLKTYQQQVGSSLFSLSADEEKCDYKNNPDELIFRIVPNNTEDRPYSIQTGNYIGTFKHGENQITINSRFGDSFLKRMLNFVNDVYLVDVDTGTGNKDSSLSWIIYYLFIQLLEKSALVGFPKAYTTVKYHEAKLHGQLDVLGYIQRDIPFRGKISSKSREQQLIPEIIDVLAQAITIISKNHPTLLREIPSLKSFLMQERSRQRVDQALINKAIQSKALLNPLFVAYRQVLRYSEMIIQQDFKLPKNDANSNKSASYLLNVAELFEIYIRKLLQQNFPDWHVESPKLKVYQGMFYERHIIPDIVMRKENNVIIFDTKYKTMNYNRNNSYGMGDVDRSDFFQIHTYISYYQNIGCHVIAGGLIYPLSQQKPSDEKTDDRHHSGLFVKDPSKVKFIIDGVVASSDFNELQTSENEFIGRVRGLINSDSLL